MTTQNRTGVPKVSARRRQLAKWQQERQRKRVAIIVAAIVLLLIVSIPVVGYTITFVLPPRHVVSSVNGVENTLGDMVEIVKANVAFQTQGGGQPRLSTLPFETLNNLIESELIRQQAPTLGLFVSQDEIDARLRENFYPTIPAGQQPSSDQLEREFRESLNNYLVVTQYSRDEYREIVRRSILREKARELVADQVPGVEEHVFVEWIVLDVASRSVQSDSDTIRQRLADGTEFAVLAQQHSVDNKFADSTGTVGWLPRQAFPELEEDIFSLEQNTLSAPLLSSVGYYLVRVKEGPETRTVNDKMKEAIKTSVFNQFLLDLRRSNDVEVDFGSDHYSWLVRKVTESLPPQSQGQQ